MKITEIDLKVKEEPSEDNYKSKDFTIFDILDAMTINKSELNFKDDTVKKVYDQYMINKWLSMCELLIDIVFEVNKMKNLTDEEHFTILSSLLPKSKFYFKYVKKSKDLSLEEKKYVAHYFETGLKKAEDYIRILSEDEIKGILSKYKFGKNEKIKIK